MRVTKRFLSVFVKPQTLRQRLTGILSTVLLVAVLLGTAGVIRFVYQTEQAAWQSRQDEAAQNAASTVATFIRRVQDYMTFASVLDRYYLERNPQILTELMDRNQALVEIVRVDKEGNVFATAHRGLNPVLSNLFTIPQSSWFLKAREGNAYVGAVQISAVNEPYLILSIPAPDGGVVAARLRMNVLWDVVEGIRFGETGEAYVVTQAGKIIAHPDHSVVLNQTTIADRPEMIEVQNAPGNIARGTYRNFEGTEVVGTAVPIPNRDWIIITEISRAEAFAATRNALIVLGGGALVFGTLIDLLVNYLLNILILRPIEELRDGAKRIGQGDLDHRLSRQKQDEIGQVSTAFNKMAAQLKERETALAQARDEALDASRLKSRLLANVSHDLRTPLNGILGYTDMLKEGVYGPLTDRQTTANERILSNTKRLLLMVNSLLGQAQIESGKVEFHYGSFDPEDLIHELENMMGDWAGRKKVELITEIEPGLHETLIGDFQYLQQILMNLVGNALKFTDKGSVKVRFYPDGTNWAIEVSDTGIGIPPEAQNQIFDPFWQVDNSTTRERGGIGLGLSIVQQLATLMGGNVRLVSEVGKGSTFTVTLPRNPQGETNV